MGCCISKCRPEKHSQQLQQQHDHQFNHVHDKLVISQPSPTPSIPHHHSSSKKISPYSPPSPTSSSSSISSFTCTTTTSNNTISSTTSSLSSASSALSSKDRSFSNEFLWSCYKDNPHIIRINSLREEATRNIKKPSSPQHSFTPLKLSPPPQKVQFTMPQKRLRSNSPTNLTRQKSFRKEPAERSNNIIPSRMLGSPSPSSRFNGSVNTNINNSVSKRTINGSKVSAAHCVSSSIRKESFKATSPINKSSMSFHNGLRNRETCTAYRVGSKIDETLVNDVLSNDMDSMMEDIDNPLISLDCFIFL